MSVQLLIDLQKSLISFFDDLNEQFPRETDFILIRIAIKDTISPIEIMKFFIEKILPERELIVNRSDSFFLEKNSLFTMGNFKSETFKNLWKNKIDDENKLIVWQWLDCFLKIVEKYKMLN